MLRPLSETFSKNDYPQVLVGLSQPDDAAVYQIDSQRAMISTTDFFPPVVDTPYEFGAIAAANALSDVYAMGGRPLMAINLAAWPDDLDMSLLTEILRGGAEKVKEAGAVIAGGHSISDQEPKYGLSVTGEVHLDQIIRKSGALVGDILILTKPLGTGAITTALKRGLAKTAHIEEAVKSMARLNRRASELAQKYRVHAMTDITGFGLAGHGHEMAQPSQVGFRVYFSKLEWLAGALQYAQKQIFPGGLERNRQYFGRWLAFDDRLSAWQQALLFDPQTSGGLLMAVSADRADTLLADLRSQGSQAAVIGEVIPGQGHIAVLP